MNLALLSDQDSPSSQAAIKRLIGHLNLDSTTAAYIASMPDPDRIFFRNTQAIYRSSGIDLDTYIDLETGFSEALMEEVLQKPLIHLSGGDTFRFLHSLKARKLEKSLTEFAKKGGALIGVSAGAMLMTPSIESARLCGDQNRIELNDLSALNLVDFQFTPHATKNSNEREAAKQLANKHKKSIFLCSDGEGILQLDDCVSILGEPVQVKA
ncbi:Type 1 glutamine amidotransferase-like domain-containing protein [Endozoicomonas arenosclerae]|uniref:Type 1 glutamine amidotransferase-like domain-containing protein n=1 Tax=Endozoicomonas arenosclerae TaxID=1633495 RepID=UPI000780CB1E|nr:Type 1 glutamine amidotransferase-like domain-containing protein [Endozoicomonas arenosclerae]